MGDRGSHRGRGSTPSGRGRGSESRGRGRGGEFKSRGRGQGFKGHPDDKKPEQTRKQVEQEQQSILQKQTEELDEEILQHERDKRNTPKGIETTYTLVKNKALNKLDKIPDISQYWVDKKTSYLPFLQENNHPESEEVIELMNLDISSLLRKKHNQFWSQIIFDPSLLAFLDSYLRFRTRPYEPSQQSRAQDLLFKRVFCVLLRTSTNKETGADFMDPKYYAELVYEKHIWDVPKILDLCVLYGACNRDIVTKMVDTLFKLQPKYLEDLKDAVPQICKTLVDSADKLEKLLKEKAKDVEELVDYLVDIVASIGSFMKVCTKSAHLFKSILRKLPEIYENFLLVMKNHKERSTHAKNAMGYLLDCVSVIVEQCYVAPLTTKSIDFEMERYFGGKIDQPAIFEEFLQLLEFLAKISESEGGHLFLAEWGKKFSLQSRLYELMDNKSSLKIDEGRLDYVLYVLNNICGHFEPVKQSPASTTPTALPELGDVELASLVEQVRDVFPDYGDGFIIECLKAFNHNAETVINSILEGSLPKAVASMDRKAKKVVSVKKENSLLATRKNVFDGDEFDIRNNDAIDYSKIYIKGTKEKDFVNFIDDKKEVKAMKSFYSEYEYEDEYDDSLDEFAGNFVIGTEQTQEEGASIIENGEVKETSEEATSSPKDEEEKEEVIMEPSYVPRGRGGHRGRGRGNPHNRKDRSIGKRFAFVNKQ